MHKEVDDNINGLEYEIMFHVKRKDVPFAFVSATMAQ